MKSEATSPEEYLNDLPVDRKVPMNALRDTILQNLPVGFEETISYGMLGYVVPHSIYPKGYHASPDLPLPFINIASQKNYISLYHMGIYADHKLLAWFKAEYQKYNNTQLDMGKSCIRFKKVNQIPLSLIGELVSKITVDQWIKLYEGALHK